MQMRLDDIICKVSANNMRNYQLLRNADVSKKCSTTCRKTIVHKENVNPTSLLNIKVIVPVVQISSFGYNSSHSINLKHPMEG